MQEEYLKILEFDYAVELAKKDPETFEQYRLNAIEAIIDKAPEHTRKHLRRLQWRIKQLRKRSANAQNSTHSKKSVLPKARVLSFPVSGTTTSETDN